MCDTAVELMVQRIEGNGDPQGVVVHEVTPVRRGSHLFPG
jgi:DNA-binding LacI/PurR family transcriptional regulator